MILFLELENDVQIPNKRTIGKEIRIELAGLPEEKPLVLSGFLLILMPNETVYELHVSIQFGNDAKEHYCSESLVQTRYSTGLLTSCPSIYCSTGFRNP